MELREVKGKLMEIKGTLKGQYICHINIKHINVSTDKHINVSTDKHINVSTDKQINN